MKSKASIAAPALESMTLEHLRATAKAAGVSVGKSKKNTISNLVAAINKGKVHFKSYFTISTNPAKPGEASQRKTHYAATFRTYKSGPGAENEVHITPDNAVEDSPIP